MCRLAAFPPGMKKGDALDIIHNMKGGNSDGFGSVHVMNGKFIVDKSPEDFSKLAVEGNNLLSHMPYDGWTVAHVRAVSYGKKCLENTHPFVHGDYALVHNGTWVNSFWVRNALNWGDTKVKWEGNTDSEVMCWMMNKLGPLELYSYLAADHTSAAILSLDLVGNLWAIRTLPTADMELCCFEPGKVTVASDIKYEHHPVKPKWVVAKYDPAGKLVNHWLKK